MTQPISSFWLGDGPLVLASKSQARAALLGSAGLPFEVRPADLDERSVEKRAEGGSPAVVARLLAEAKALEISSGLPGRLVVGADQTLALEGRRFSKPLDRDAAAEQLRLLRGKTHRLASGYAVVRDGEVLGSGVAEAKLTMRDFSEAFLGFYLDVTGEAVTSSVGGYQLEGLGVHLFASVEGDHATILGLPLVPLLGLLREVGAVVA